MSSSTISFKQGEEQPQHNNTTQTTKNMTYHTLSTYKLTIVTFFALSSAVVMIALAIWSSNNKKSPSSYSYLQYQDDYEWDAIDIKLQGQALCELASSLPSLIMLSQNSWSDSSNCPNEGVQTSSSTGGGSVPEWCSTPWHGITCDEDNKVIQVNITGLNSVYTSASTIPTSFGITLSGSLIYLELSTNSLQGSIPSQLGYLKKLSYLGLSYNSLTNSIPAGLLGGMSALTKLSLQHNSLIGSLPSDLYDLDKLEELRLAGNQLSGTLSSSLDRLQSLRTLYFFSNRFSGTIPSQLTKLSSTLSAVGLGKNQLTGTIPKTLSKLTNLRIFRVQYNSLTGTVPSELSSISTLHGMKLNCNYFTEDPFSEGVFDNVFYDDRSQDDTIAEHPEPGAKGWKQNCQQRQRKDRGLRQGRMENIESSMTIAVAVGNDDEEEEEDEEKE